MRPRSAMLVAWLGLWACGAEPAAAPTRFELRVVSVAVAPVDGEVFDEDELRATIGEAVLRSHAFLDPARHEGPVLATAVRLGEVEGADGGRVLRVEFAAVVPPEQHAVLGRDMEATIELERRDGTLVADQDVPVALARGVAVMDAKVQLVFGGEADARRLLGASDPEIVVLALEQIAKQRWRDAADEVAALLGHDDERVVASAVECLGSVGGPHHAAALLRHVRLADSDQARRLYETLAALGGDEARGFLEFAARNEDDPVGADLASRALRRLHGVPEGSSDDGDTLRGHRP